MITAFFFFFLKTHKIFRLLLCNFSHSPKESNDNNFIIIIIVSLSGAVFEELPDHKKGFSKFILKL